MQSSPILNLGPAPLNKPRPEPAFPPDEFNRMGDVVEQARSEIRRVRTQIERHQDKQESYERRTMIQFIAIALLAAIVGGALWYVYPNVKGQQKAGAEMLGIQNSAAALDVRVGSLEGKLDNAVGGLPALRQRMDELGSGMKTAFETAGSQAQTAANQIGQRIRDDLNKSIQAIQSRMSGLESNQKEASGRVNELEQKIAGLQRELALMRQESSTAVDRIKQIQEDDQTRAGALSNLNQKMASQQTAIDSISNRIESKRVDFEVKNRINLEIVPGISLTIRSMNAGRQEVEGTLTIAKKTIPIRQHGVQTPIVFYNEGESRPSELVFTRVDKNTVSGYLVIPVSQAASAALLPVGAVYDRPTILFQVMRAFIDRRYST
jgi:predicted  nucleic acid-binding Zn-ribbon protein